MSRNKDLYFLRVARLISTQATCARRRVGCILVNSRKHILATGYNGVAAGMPHCTDQPCSGASCESGTGLDACEAIHAEQNALLQCRDVHEIDIAYVTTAPCIHCLKLLLNTSCREIVFWEDYPHSQKSKELWIQAGRIWTHVQGGFSKEDQMKLELVTI